LDAAGTDAVVVAFALVRLLAAVAGVDFFWGMIVISSDTFSDAAIFDADEDCWGVWRPPLSTDFLLPPLKYKLKTLFKTTEWKKHN
jgi:hypothetical protein